MLIVHVFVEVKEGQQEAFREATQVNARSSVQEPGIVRFDVLQEQGEPTHFVLIEIYRTPDDPARHKETDHYATWRDTVAPMMAAPRRSIKYEALYPEDAAWERPS